MVGIRVDVGLELATGIVVGTRVDVGFRAEGGLVVEDEVRLWDVRVVRIMVVVGVVDVAVARNVVWVVATTMIRT